MLDAGTLAAIAASFTAVGEFHLTSDQGSYV
jgi:hypothetical protein